MSFLLEFVEGGAVRGRYSIIGMDPDVVWRERTAPRVNRTPRGPPASVRACAEAPLASLRSLLPRAVSIFPTACRRWRPGCSAISATTWFV